MNRRTWTGVVVVASAASALLAAIACSSSSLPPAAAVSTGGQCATSPGEFPIANCVPYPSDAQVCNSPALNCPTTPCTAGSPCLAMGSDNSGQTTASLRIRKLNVTAPPPLATLFTQQAVIDKGINLYDPAPPAAQTGCGESGDGTFNWLIQFNTMTHEVTTGGGAPTKDPFGLGYCFVDTMIEGLNVKPVTVKTTQNSDGSFTSDPLPKLYVPIFIAAGQTGANGKSVIVLPLTNSKVENVLLSDSNNCIGSYNANAVTPYPKATYCTDDPTSCVRWTTAGSLGGYITLSEADQVLVPQLGESLCVLLTGGSSIDTSNPNEKTCKKDASGIIAKGDFCSTTQKAGGCQDAFWLAATFAASAAKIVAPNQDSCKGVPIGGASDAGGQ